jgi:hypothetical protein
MITTSATPTIGAGSKLYGNEISRSPMRNPQPWDYLMMCSQVSVLVLVLCAPLVEETFHPLARTRKFGGAKCHT